MGGRRELGIEKLILESDGLSLRLPFLPEHLRLKLLESSITDILFVSLLHSYLS